jgi:hypothetical protein
MGLLQIRFNRPNALLLSCTKMAISRVLDTPHVLISG